MANIIFWLHISYCTQKMLLRHTPLCLEFQVFTCPSERKGSDATTLTDGAVAVSDGDSRRSIKGLRGGGCAQW